MNQPKTARLRKTFLTAAAILVILTAGARAQQSLGDLVTEGGFDWMMGRWAAETDQGNKIYAFYRWELKKHLITTGFKMGDYESHNMIFYKSSEDKIAQVGVDNRGGTSRGEWEAEGNRAVARLQHTRANGEIRRMGIAHSKVDADTMKVDVYELDSDGWLAEEPRFTVKYKRQKKQAGKKESGKTP